MNDVKKTLTEADTDSTSHSSPVCVQSLIIGMVKDFATDEEIRKIADKLPKPNDSIQQTVFNIHVLAHAILFLKGGPRNKKFERQILEKLTNILGHDQK